MSEQESKVDCQLLLWDSEFFGRRIARISRSGLTLEELAAVERWARSERIDCIYYLIQASDVQAARSAECAGYHLVDVRVTLTKRGLGPAEPLVRVREAEASDLTALERLARVSHEDTRFYADPNFDRERCSELYATWIRKSVSGEADVVFVAEGDREPTGYITCTRKGRAASIGLVAVAKDQQGRGHGRRLLRAAISWCSTQGIDELRVVTQGRNVRAQRLYQREGFVTELVELWYHGWFDGAAGALVSAS